MEDENEVAACTSYCVLQYVLWTWTHQETQKCFNSRRLQQSRNKYRSHDHSWSGSDHSKLYCQSTLLNQLLSQYVQVQVPLINMQLQSCQPHCLEIGYRFNLLTLNRDQYNIICNNYCIIMAGNLLLSVWELSVVIFNWYNSYFSVIIIDSHDMRDLPFHLATAYSVTSTIILCLAYHNKQRTYVINLQ